MNWLNKIIAALIGGFIIAFIGTMLIASAGVVSKVSFPLFFALGVAVALLAPNGGKAWRRLLIISGLMCLLLPIGGLIHTGTAVAEQTEGAKAVGTMIGGGIATGIMGFIGFFLGAVLLVIGFSVGREKQVIVITQAQAQ